MVSEPQQREMEERAKEVLEEFDEPFEVAMFAVRLEVALREHSYQFIKFRDYYEDDFNAVGERQKLRQAAEEGEVLEWAQGEYEG